MTTPFPTSVPLVNVTGALYGADTTPRTGRVLFTMTHFLQDPTDKITIPTFRAIAILGVTSFVVQNGAAVPAPAPAGPGCFSIVLVATDYNALITESGAPTYTVTYDLDGDDPYVRYYQIPHTPSPVDISQLAEAQGP